MDWNLIVTLQFTRGGPGLVLEVRNRCDVCNFKLIGALGVRCGEGRGSMILDPPRAQVLPDSGGASSTAPRHYMAGFWNIDPKLDPLVCVAPLGALPGVGGGGAVDELFAACTSP